MPTTCGRALLVQQRRPQATCCRGLQYLHVHTGGQSILPADALTRAINPTSSYYSTPTPRNASVAFVVICATQPYLMSTILMTEALPIL